jgi:uncharacterized protein DUF551
MREIMTDETRANIDAFLAEKRGDSREMPGQQITEKEKFTKWLKQKYPDVELRWSSEDPNWCYCARTLFDPQVLWEAWQAASAPSGNAGSQPADSGKQPSEQALPDSREMPGQRSGWISVKDRMPKFGILVLVANQAWYPGWPKVMHGHLDSEGEWCGHYADLERCGQPTEKGLPTSEPTHWMPLPDPPASAPSGNAGSQSADSGKQPSEQAHWVSSPQQEIQALREERRVLVEALREALGYHDGRIFGDLGKAKSRWRAILSRYPEERAKR